MPVHYKQSLRVTMQLNLYRYFASIIGRPFRKTSEGGKRKDLFDRRFTVRPFLDIDVLRQGAG
ncbi:MAG: hypothetical protein K0S46_567 [Moraxellaceae bacterium]|nr:hypothetical protein [Moraxellaceae bacterium]